MEFKYFDGHQRTKPWYDLRLGVPTASRLKDWLAVSKAKNSAGKPLKARLDYETELIFERTFGVAFNNYVNDAMLDGVEFEKFAIAQYEKITRSIVKECGAWYNDHFVASPDGIVEIPGKDEYGLAEVKVLRDNKFTEVLISGVPDDHYKQIQGELFASRMPWCDYIAINLATKMVKIIRVLPDQEFFDYLELALLEKLTVAEFPKENLYPFVDKLPDEFTQKLNEEKGEAAWL